jgi:hypothetical protein
VKTASLTEFVVDLSESGLMCDNAVTVLPWLLDSD